MNEIPPPLSPKVGDTVFYSKTGWKVGEIATLYLIKAGATKIWVRPHQVSMTSPDTPASS